MKARLWLILALLACTFVATASNRSAVRKSIESSMMVTGMIEIGTDGAVTGHQLDQPDKLADGIREFVGKTVSGFRFEPILVDGKVVHARTKMRLLLIAKKLEGEDYQLRLGSASFGEPSGGPTSLEARGELLHPRYPPRAHASNVSGAVYLVLKIGKQGAVEEVAVEQTNLTVLGTSKQMQDARQMLEQASLVVAKKWMFNIPVSGEEAKEPFWIARVPVVFELTSRGVKQREQYWQWQAYVPGPKHHVPWLDKEENRRSPEAIAAGEVHPVGHGPKLISPLGGG